MMADPGPTDREGLGPELLGAYTRVLIEGARSAGELAQSSISVALYGLAFILIAVALIFKLNVSPATLQPVEFIGILTISMVMLILATVVRVYSYRVETELLVGQRRMGEKAFDRATVLAQQGNEAAAAAAQKEIDAANKLANEGLIMATTPRSPGTPGGI